MSCSNGIGIIVWIYLLNIKGVVVRGQTPGPNAVALINGQTMLDCNTTTVAACNWQHTPDGVSNTVKIASGCIVNGSYSAYYRTEQPGGNRCRLIIGNVTMEQAGVYTCYDGASIVYKSLVTVIDHVASVVVYNQSEVVVADQLNISCSINYTGPSSPAPYLRPLPYWTSPGQIFNSTTYHPSTNVVTLVATVTVQRPTVPIFQCNTVFEVTGSTVGYNATAPADSFTVGNTTEQHIQYPVTVVNTTISGSNCANNSCTCGNQSDVMLTCQAYGYPKPTVQWSSVLHFKDLGNASIVVTINGNYSCISSNEFGGKIYNATVSIGVSNCHTDPNSSGKTDLITTIVLAVVLGGYGLYNIIATIVFLVYYNRKSNTLSDDKEMSTFRNKSKLNARFPWLQRMLPCMNESRGNAGCTFLWVILFILMSVLAGIIVFPILVAMVNFSRKRKNSKENSDIGMSNQKRSKTAGNPSTAAHGDFEDPYDEIKTMRHDRKHTLEEPTSAKNTKDAEKVFYARVNRNLDTGEDIERYSVTMSS